MILAQDSTRNAMGHKNTVRINITNPLIFGGKSIVVGYERLLTSHTSFSINLGPTSFPSLSFLNADSIEAKSNLSDKGFNVSGDFRFYLSKENKHTAPRGVYIGPYFSYNYFEKTNSWAIKSTNGGNPLNVETNTSLSVSTLGIEMGYQFILWKRVSLDMILVGPGVAAYNLKASLASNLSQEDKEKFFEKLNQALSDRFPGYGRVIDEGEFQRRGSSNSTSLGYRYMIMVGYRF